MNAPQALIVSAILLWIFSREGGAIPIARADWITPTRGQPFESHFRAADRRYGLPPGFISRVAYQESNYNPNAQGAAGEIGLMQITPRWHPGVNPYDPVESIYYAASLFRRYYNEFGSWEAAIAAYNWGETNVRNKGIARVPTITANYIRGVTRDVGIV